MDRPSRADSPWPGTKEVDHRIARALNTAQFKKQVRILRLIEAPQLPYVTWQHALSPGTGTLPCPYARRYVPSPAG